jgi:membrane-associated phospholipid phosphatase
MSLRASEWIVIAYFAYLAAVALGARLPIGRRAGFIAEVLGTTAVTLWVAGLTTGAGLVIRDWMPAAYLLTMYWMPARLVTSSNVSFEAWLASLDRRWLPNGATMLTDRLPRIALEFIELSYLLCYPLIPIGVGVLYAAGARAEVDRYWTAVLLSGALSYGPLPRLATHPPRRSQTPALPRVQKVRSLNLIVLHHASVQWNTFPSGHVATAVAAALAVTAREPLAGSVLGILAAGIAAAAVVGRYHYLADTAAGVAAALMGFLVSRVVSLTD